MFEDMTPRYVPSELMVAPGGELLPVERVESFNRGQHPKKAPLVADCTAVRCTLSNGAVRWFGCDHAYIDSSLRMVVVGTNPRDKVRMSWEVVK